MLQTLQNELRYQNATKTLPNQNATKTLPKRLRYATMENAETLQNNAETLQ